MDHALLCLQLRKCLNAASEPLFTPHLEMVHLSLLHLLPGTQNPLKITDSLRPKTTPMAMVILLLPRLSLVKTCFSFSTQSDLKQLIQPPNENWKARFLSKWLQSFKQNTTCAANHVNLKTTTDCVPFGTCRSPQRKQTNDHGKRRRRKLKKKP